MSTDFQSQFVNLLSTVSRAKEDDEQALHALEIHLGQWAASFGPKLGVEAAAWASSLIELLRKDRRATVKRTLPNRVVLLRRRDEAQFASLSRDYSDAAASRRDGAKRKLLDFTEKCLRQIRSARADAPNIVSKKMKELEAQLERGSGARWSLAMLRQDVWREIRQADPMQQKMAPLVTNLRRRRPSRNRAASEFFGFAEPYVAKVARRYVDDDSEVEALVNRVVFAIITHIEAIPFKDVDFGLLGFLASKRAIDALRASFRKRECEGIAPNREPPAKGRSHEELGDYRLDETDPLSVGIEGLALVAANAQKSRSPGEAPDALGAGHDDTGPAGTDSDSAISELAEHDDEALRIASDLEEFDAEKHDIDYLYSPVLAPSAKDEDVQQVTQEARAPIAAKARLLRPPTYEELITALSVVSPRIQAISLLDGLGHSRRLITCIPGLVEQSSEKPEGAVEAQVSRFRTAVILAVEIAEGIVEREESEAAARLRRKLRAAMTARSFLQTRKSCSCSMTTKVRRELLMALVQESSSEQTPMPEARRHAGARLRAHLDACIAQLARGDRSHASDRRAAEQPIRIALILHVNGWSDALIASVLDKPTKLVDKQTQPVGEWIKTMHAALRRWQEGHDHA